jgi:hypothetical protein
MGQMACLQTLRRSAQLADVFVWLGAARVHRRAQGEALRMDDERKE